jgi:TonB family protein
MRIPRRLILIWLLWVVTAQAQDFAIYVQNLREEGGRRSVSALTLPLPVYPSDLIRARVSGHVAFRFRVNADGSVADQSVLEASQGEFIEPAKSAVARWRFTVASDTTEETWMRCTLTFRANDEPNYFPTFSAGFADTRLGGREVFQVAAAQAKKDGIALDQFAGFEGASVFLSDSGHPLIWCVTWVKAGSYGEYYRVWINDVTREAKAERKEKPNHPAPATHKP